jgi:hypothetical protein
MWMVSIIFSIGPIVGLFYSRCCANFNLLLPYLKSGKCSWNLILKFCQSVPCISSCMWGSLAGIYHVCLIYFGLVYVVLTAAFNYIVSDKSDFNICVFNSFVMSHVSFPTYVNFVHFIFWLSYFCFLLLLILLKIAVSYLLLIRICCILLFSFCSFSGVILYVFILLWRYLPLSSAP